MTVSRGGDAQWSESGSAAVPLQRAQIVIDGDGDLAVAPGLSADYGLVDDGDGYLSLVPVGSGTVRLVIVGSEIIAY